MCKKKVLASALSVFFIFSSTSFIYSVDSETLSLINQSTFNQSALNAKTSQSNNNSTKTPDPTASNYNYAYQTQILANKIQAQPLQPDPQLAMSSKDYLVTAGDVYKLGFYAMGEEVTYTIVVDSSYSVKVANVGVVNGAGKTFVQLRKEVENIINKNFPMSGVQMTLVSPARFKVLLSGEVKETTVKPAWSLMRLSEVIEESKTDFSSTRDIEIKSSDGTVRTYDLFKAFRDADVSQDPFLRPDDVIKIKRIDRKVTVYGAVERPGIYELLPGENLKELVEVYGGGLLKKANLNGIELFRAEGIEHSAGRKMYLDEKSIESNFEIKDSDKVYVSSYEDKVPVVWLEGAILITDTLDSSKKDDLAGSNKTSVTFFEGENYAFFARRNYKYFSSASDLKNAYIKRGKEFIPIDLEDLIYNADTISTEEVKNFDTLLVPFIQSFVTVAGAVKKPGRYPYIPDRNWSYYISLAGGFDKSENDGQVVTIKDKNNKRHSKSDPITPETTITAETTSFTYYFSKYAPLITTTLTAISTVLTIYIATEKID